MVIYTDFQNEYKFLDFSLSHSQLLIRSLKTNNRNYNIDIFFKGVSILLMPIVLKGIEISLVEFDGVELVSLKEYGFEVGEDHMLFSIKDSKGKIYYINSMAFGVYRNTLEILETSIHRYDFGSLGEKILWFNGK
jgi:hypothetical protein